MSPLPGGPLAGVLLAGGASRRMGRPKAALPWRGEPFAARIARLMRAAGVDPLVVVTGLHDAETRAVLPAALRALVVRNPEPERGQLSSLQLALAWLEEHAPETPGALVALVDHPAVRPETYAALVRAARAPARQVEIALPTHHGRRGHPLVFLRSVWPEILGADAPDGARSVVRRAPERVAEIEVDDAGILRDVDRPADLERLAGRG